MAWQLKQGETASLALSNLWALPNSLVESTHKHKWSLFRSEFYSAGCCIYFLVSWLLGGGLQYSSQTLLKIIEEKEDESPACLPWWWIITIMSSVHATNINITFFSSLCLMSHINISATSSAEAVKSKSKQGFKTMPQRWLEIKIVAAATSHGTLSGVAQQSVNYI